MKNRLLAAAAAAASLIAVGAAHATTVDFAYDEGGSPMATGSFTYATGDTGVLDYADLSAFSVTVAGQTYSLANVDTLTDYVWFAYDTATNSFDSTLNGCGFAGCNFQESLGAINSAGTYGFFFNPAPSGSYHEYVSSTIGNFDSVVLTVQAVPEPATWAMLLLGFFGLGAAIRGRRRVLATA